MEKFGLRFHKLRNTETNEVLFDDGNVIFEEEDEAGLVRRVREDEEAKTEAGPEEEDMFLWTVSWDGCIENKRTGMSLFFCNCEYY